MRANICLTRVPGGDEKNNEAGTGTKSEVMTNIFFKNRKKTPKQIHKSQ